MVGADEQSDVGVFSALGSFRYTLAGVIGATSCVFVGQPFDTVKVRMQTQVHTPGVPAQYRGPLDCLLKTFRQEGIKALYKGSTPALTAALCENAVLFTVNGVIREAVVGRNVDPSKPLTTFQYTTIGACSGLFSGFALCPADMVKCRLQVQHNLLKGGAKPPHGTVIYTGPVDCVIKTLKADGPTGMFRGGSVVLIRDMPFNAIFLGTYEGLRKLQADVLTKWERDSGSDKEIGVNDLGTASLLLAGGLAGMSGWGVMFPIDVVKSRAQTNPIYGKMWAHQSLFSIIKSEGVPALYRGYSAAVLRAFPANAALFVGYEMSKRVLFM